MTGHDTVDFDLAGMVRVRVTGGGREIAAVGRQLGLPRSPVAGDADISIEIVDRIPRTGLERKLGRDEATFDDDSFLVTRAKAKARARVRIPFEDIGAGPVIQCEPGLPAVPLLVPILAVTALTKGLVPLHAGAFEWNGCGVVVTGWSKGGKTETLLATAEAGARYVGDEWCYIDPSRALVVGIPEPVTVWGWHVRHLPSLRARVPLQDRIRMGLLDLPDRAESRIPDRWRGLRPARLLRRVAFHARDRANTWLDPHELFGADGVSSVSFDRLVLVVSAETDDVTLRPMAASEIAARMVSSVRYELEPLLQHYRMFRYAFPERISPALDRLDADLETAIHRGLDDVPGWVLAHPYPVGLGALAEGLRPIVEPGGR